MSTVVEGIENEAQLAALLPCGCDAFQGYLFGHPCPAEEVEHLLRGSDAPLRRSA
jgi:EAL domain-containing protein (putative c-di-GMP-specific phosphodiesterase class I)